MIDMAQNIVFQEAQTMEVDGWPQEVLVNIEVTGTVSYGQYTIDRDENGNIMTAGLRIVVKGFEYEKLSNPKFVIIDGQRLKIKGAAKYPNHWEIYA